ncbi:hypothetical protein [Bradyrhizobium arachidis]|uniref:hypothetical protein n=1 Tax=Bradyrhizobium arachidis TaxID=858423 RepID=UPI0011608B7A|nr:hypothetical protein [Bradyrhizobium arachidis]
MTELTAMTMAATARHSIGKRRDRSEKKPTSARQLQGDSPDKPNESDHIFALSNDGGGQNFLARLLSRDVRVRTRSKPPA